MTPRRLPHTIVALLIMLLACSALAPYAVAKESDIHREKLERRVKKALREDNVTLRTYIDDVFQLADIYAEEGKDEQAMRLYEKALEVDSWRFEYQLKLAHLLHKHGNNEGAIEKARVVCLNTKSVDQHRNAKQLLSSLGASCTERTFEKIDQTTQNVEIVLVPIGKVDRKLLTDVMEELQEMMGIQYSIGEGKIRLGNMDRRSDDKYLTLLVESVKNGLSKNQLKRLMSKENLSAADMKTYEGKVKFLDETFREAKVSSQDIRTFHETLDRLKGTGQYDASRLLADIRRKYPVAARSVIKGYLGITQEDIYEGNSNFLFGWARKKHGLMSYHRFTSEFNDEPPNYERVRDRTIKQAISSSFHIFGIPRCTTPTCARGYPHSLSEHDRKGIEICTWCTEQLAAYVGRNARASTD